MAESKVEIALIANARKLLSGLKEGERGAKRFFDTIKKHQDSLRKVAMVATAALASQLYVLKKMVDAAGIQEKAEDDLRAALKTAGETRESVTKGLILYAAALQKVTTFGDEEIIAAQALLVTYGVTTDKLEGATKATLDFAAATGRDLTTAALTVGKAVGAGFTAELSRYGIILDTSTIPKTEVAAAVIDKLNSQFGGRAQAMADTYVGRMKQLSNVVGDLKESIGAALIPALTKMAEKIIPIVDKTVAWVNENRNLVGILIGVGVGGMGLIAALTTLGAILPLLATGFNLMLGPIGLVTLGLGALAGGVIALKMKAAMATPVFKQTANSLGMTQEELDALNDSMPDIVIGTEAVTAAFVEQTEKLAELSTNYEDLFGNIDPIIEQFESLAVKTRTWQEEMAKAGQVSSETFDQTGSDMEQYAIRASNTFTSTIADFLVADRGFKKALTAATIKVVTMGLQAFIQAKISEMVATTVVEKGKAVAKAPLTFGATLLALAPIAAAGAATIALLRAIKMPSFAMGGTVQRTGPAMVHEGEVIVNPRMPGKGQEALAAAGAGGVTVNFYGPVYDGVEEVKRGVARAIRGAR